MNATTRVITAGLLTAAVVAAAGGIAVAASSNPLVQTKGADVRLPLAGASQRVTIALDPDTEALASVTLDPSSGFTATKRTAKSVKFANSSVPARLEVGRDDDELDTQVTARSLDLLVGAGSFTSNLFGSGNAIVPFTVGKTPNGAPTVTLGAVTAPAGSTVATGSSVRPTKAEVRASFTSTAGFTKTVKIEVKAGRAGLATLAVELGAPYRQVLPTAQLAGQKTWTGPTCNGVTNSLSFVVDPDGTFGVVTATPTAVKLRAGETRVRVQFPNREKVELRLRSANGQTALSVDSDGKRCGAAAPAVNTAVGGPTTTNDDRRSDDRHADDKGKGRGND